MDSSKNPHLFHSRKTALLFVFIATECPKLRVKLIAPNICFLVANEYTRLLNNIWLLQKVPFLKIIEF